MEIKDSINFCSRKFGNGDLVYTMDFSQEQNWQVPAGITFQSMILFPETFPVLITVSEEQSGEQKEFVRVLVKNKSLSPVVVERLDKSFITSGIEETAFADHSADVFIKEVKEESWNRLCIGGDIVI